MCKVFEMNKLKFVGVAALLLLNVSVMAQYNSAVKIENLLKTDTTSIGQRIVYPSFDNDEVTIAKVTIPPGQSTGWHLHRFPVFAYVLQGTLTVEVKDGRKLEFPANSTFAEVINLYHNGMNNGSVDLVLIAFFMGEKGKALSEH
jgi:quercetin dioxygenase-like cupin family protein